MGNHVKPTCSFKLTPRAMLRLALLLFAGCDRAFAYTIGTPRPFVSTTCSAAMRGAVATPDTATKPMPLPETWEVPDTFSLSTLYRTDTPDSEMFKLTLFKNAAAEARVVGALLEVVNGMDADRAELISRKARTLGFALVGIWSEKTAAQYADALRNRGLVVDVSPE